jgi:hypothetical protein
MKGLPQLNRLLANMVLLLAAFTASARELNMQHYDPSDCTRHEMLYGQIHQDLMPWALKGMRPENMNVSKEFCAAQSGLFTCVLVEDGQVGAAGSCWLGSSCCSCPCCCFMLMPSAPAASSQASHW